MAISLMTEAVTEGRLEEHELIQRVLKGEREAFHPLVEAYQRQVYGLALRMLGNTHEAEDAAQDTFVQAYFKLRTYRPEHRFKTWLLSIAAHLCIDRLRRRRLEPSLFSDHVDSEDADADLEVACPAPNPEEVVIHRQRQAALRAMLAELPADERALIVMAYFNEMSHEEIAQALGTTVSAVKSRLFRARQKMSRSRWASAFQE
ncbi:MAG: sigma-70 family RNA polymerase sigma factor [Anaerolineae bacterium]|nr:sigma-70 family RNA polymerase sigma factor [Anaerolineae bacterium]